MSEIWFELYEQCKDQLGTDNAINKNNDKIKLMMAYIHDHYAGNRTPDPLLARQVLSQLSYAPILPVVVCYLEGGEGVFNTVVTGPGRVWLQTMPISNVAGEILKFMPSGK